MCCCACSALAPAVVSGCLAALWSEDSEMVGRLVRQAPPHDVRVAPLHILLTVGGWNMCVCLRVKERQKKREEKEAGRGKDRCFWWKRWKKSRLERESKTMRGSANSFYWLPGRVLSDVNPACVYFWTLLLHSRVLSNVVFLICQWAFGQLIFIKKACVLIIIRVESTHSKCNTLHHIAKCFAKKREEW